MPGRPTPRAWRRSPSSDVRTGSFADAAAHADLLVNATNGINSLAVLESIGAEALAGKTVIDLSNELVPVEGGYPRRPLPERSIGRRLQEAFPRRTSSRASTP